MTDKVIFEAQAPKFILQREESEIQGYAGAYFWEDVQGYATSKEAIATAGHLKREYPNTNFRVVERD